MLNSSQTDPKKIERARNLGALGIALQWVEGDARKAEESFFKINQEAAPISEIEMRLIKARTTPQGVAARAIARSGSGHKYWSSFSEDIQQNIESTAQEINELLFLPKLKNPIKTLDVPIVGKLSASNQLEVILDFVTIANKLESDRFESDLDGGRTLAMLKNCKKIAERINSIHPSSLGLHPMVYFYTHLGRHKIGSFYGVLSFLVYLEDKKRFNDFIKVRKDFEWLIWNYDMVPQLLKGKGALQAKDRVKDFFVEILDKLLSGTERTKVLKEIKDEKKFGALRISKKLEGNETTGKKFSRETKTAAYIREALPGCPKCKICGGYIPSRFNSIDHIKRKADGGLGTLKNAQLTHPYYNTTYKN